ncbi:MAG: hypothetical protein ACFE95_01965 [Candidatus Hodarchaeota archaeon]
MMKRRLFISFCMIWLILLTIVPITVGRSSSNEKTNFWGNVNKQAQLLDSYFSHPYGALRETPSSSGISAMANSLAATTLFAEYNLGGSSDLSKLAQNIMNASSKYFGEISTSDSRGWVSYYDFSKDDLRNYVKARKFTHDQFLMLLGLANIYLNLNEGNPYKRDYLAFANLTTDFIKDNLLETNGKWIDSVYIFNETLYTKNRFRVVEHICWTIWAALNLPSSFNSPLSTNLLTQMADFLAENGTLNGGIHSILSPGGESSDNVFKLRINALYGIINLELYDKTDEDKYLNRGKLAFDFIVNNLWDLHFKGFFDQSDDKGLLLVQGKSLSGNALACLLASKLARYIPANDTIESVYVLSNLFIEKYLQSSDELKYYISCDRDGDPLSLVTLESNIIRLWQRTNSLHIINGTIPESVSIGEKIQLELNVANPSNLTYNITVNGDQIEPYNQTTSDSHVSITLSLKKNAEIGETSIFVNFRVLNEIVDKSGSISMRIGSDRRLPQGLVYIVALGILVAMVVVARYPPKSLEDFLARLSSLSLSEEERQEISEIEQSKEEKPSQSEEKSNG